MAKDSKSACIRVFHTMKPDPSATKDTTRYYEATACNYISLYIDEFNRLEEKGTIDYAFSTNGMTQIFDHSKYPSQDKADQKSSHMHYFVKTIQAHLMGGYKIEAFDIEGYKPDEETEPTFNILNNRTVYKSLEPDYDETELLNVKLLMYHFPRGVDIRSIVILEERQFQISKNTQNYKALVYTSEDVNGRPFHVRHYLKGKPKTYEFEGIIFNRLVWDLDESFNNQTGLGACSHLKEIPTAVSLSYAEQIGSNTMSFHILEFYGVLYKTIRIELYPTGNASLIDHMDDHREQTSNFIKCGKHPTTDKLPSSDCRANPVFYEGIRKDDELPSNEDNDSSDSFDTFWTVFVILIGIVAVIALVGYEIYSLNDLVSN